jgi:hypothetical protein
MLACAISNVIIAERDLLVPNWITAAFTHWLLSSQWELIKDSKLNFDI